MVSAPPIELYEATRRDLLAEPKQLPTVWLYDDRGSRLYEQVTRLPEYYLPRREREILGAKASAIALQTRARTLVELGAGNAERTRVLLDALTMLDRVVLLDVSEQAVLASAAAISVEYPRLVVDGMVGDFERDLGELPGAAPRLVAFLGSTIGNLDPARRRAFLESVDGEALLVGLDLVKDAARLHAAYNDPRGVTEAFVRNALVAVNRELEATFDQASLEYEARWDPLHQWMDIGFRARRSHTVTIRRLDLDVPFEKGEPLRVEISAKFRRDTFEAELATAGLRLGSWWTDREGDFAVALAERRQQCP